MAGGTWNRDGVIVFAPTATSPLYRISASGGEPVAITKLDPPRQTSHRFPQFLPDGRRLLFSAGIAREATEIYLGSIDSTEGRRLMEAESAVAYASGHLLYLRQGTLLAYRFDASERKLSGDPFPLANPVGFDEVKGVGAFSASATGTIAYRARGPLRQLVWLDRSGKRLGTVWQPDENDLRSPELSPDGLRVAVDRRVQGNTDVWLIDTARGGISRFTFNAGYDVSPVWSPDGSRIVFRSARSDAADAGDLYQKPSSGAGSDELLVESAPPKIPGDWSPNGRFILYWGPDLKTRSNDVWLLPTSGERKPRPLVNQAVRPQFSPDGRWVAYDSLESGRREVYVLPFPGPAGKWQVSTGGGHSPRWRRDGKELFYIGPDGKLMAAGIQARGEVLEAGDPVALFQTQIVYGGVGPAGWVRLQYAVAPDGRFLMNVEQASDAPINLILNWAGGSK